MRQFCGMFIYSIQRIELHLVLRKNVLQFWLCYIRKMVQFQVLDLIFFLTGHFTRSILSFCWSDLHEMKRMTMMTYTMAYSKDVVILGYPRGLDLIMIETATHSYVHSGNTSHRTSFFDGRPECRCAKGFENRHIDQIGRSIRVLDR